MSLRIPVQLRPAALTPEQIQVIQNVLAETSSFVESGIANPKNGFEEWLKGKKSYMLTGLTITTAAFGWWYKLFTAEVAVGMILSALGYAAHRSAMTTETMRQTEQIVNAVVAPASPAALKTAAAAEVLDKPPLTA